MKLISPRDNNLIEICKRFNSIRDWQKYVFELQETSNKTEVLRLWWFANRDRLRTICIDLYEYIHAYIIKDPALQHLATILPELTPLAKLIKKRSKDLHARIRHNQSHRYKIFIDKEGNDLPIVDMDLDEIEETIKLISKYLDIINQYKGNGLFEYNIRRDDYSESHGKILAWLSVNWKELNPMLSVISMLDGASDEKKERINKDIHDLWRKHI